MNHQQTNSRISCRNGYWSMQLDGDRVLKDMGASILTEEELLLSTGSQCSMAVDGNRVLFNFPGLQACLELKETDGTAVVYDFAITNTSGCDQRIRAASPVIYNGKWNDEGLFTVSKQAKVLTLPAERSYGDDGIKGVENGNSVTSFWSIAVHDPADGRSFLAGVCGVPSGLVRYRSTSLLAVFRENVRVLQWECEVDLQSGVRGVRLEPGGTIRTGLQCILLWEGSLQSGLETYGAMLSERFGRHKGNNTAPAGWCSWYAGYYENINRSELDKNLSYCGEIPGLQFFQVDMGWEGGEGTKTAGEPITDTVKFPGGMKELSDAIAQQGLKPGIWIRPFQGWKRGEAGIPGWAEGECIDLSHPEARAWIRKLASTIAKDWGYKYIKFDFVTFDLFKLWGMKMVFSSAIPLKPYDDTVTNLQMYRMGLEALREGAGEECFLLGCNCLTGPALGLLDGNRTGDDVNEGNWDKTFTMGVKSVHPQYFLNGRIWFNDPDCVLLHGSMSEERCRMWGTLVSLTGQMGIISTRLYQLEPDRMELLKALFPVINCYARPLDLIDRDPPEIWHAGIDAGWEEYAVAAFFNWKGGAAAYEVSTSDLGLEDGGYIAYEFWSRRFLGAFSEKLAFGLEQETCGIIAVRKHSGRPQVAGTSRHILQGAVELQDAAWDEEQSRLNILVRVENPFDIAVYIPEGYTYSGNSGSLRCGGRILDIPSGMAEAGRISLDFRKSAKSIAG